MIFVYIIQSLRDNGYYIGICKNINVRLKKHNNGGVNSTKNRRPFRLVYKEQYADYKLAREKEKELKSFKGGVKFKELLS